MQMQWRQSADPAYGQGFLSDATLWLDILFYIFFFFVTFQSLFEPSTTRSSKLYREIGISFRNNMQIFPL